MPGASPAVADPQPYFAELSDLRRETKNTLHKLRDIVMFILCEVSISPTIRYSILRRGVFALFFYAVPLVRPGSERRLPVRSQRQRLRKDGPLTPLASITFSLWGGRSERTRVNQRGHRAR
jgi:hypothetical protein